MSGRRPHGTPHRSKLIPLASRLDHRTLLARYERLLTEYDRLAGKLMVSEAEVRRIGKASGRNLDRMIEASKRAAVAESALAASQTRPAQCVRLLLRAERLLYRLSYPECPSCGLSGWHRHNCRIESLVIAIQRAVPV